MHALILTRPWGSQLLYKGRLEAIRLYAERIHLPPPVRLSWRRAGQDELPKFGSLDEAEAYIQRAALPASQRRYPRRQTCSTSLF